MKPTRMGYGVLSSCGPMHAQHACVCYGRHGHAWPRACSLRAAALFSPLASSPKPFIKRPINQLSQTDLPLNSACARLREKLRLLEYQSAIRKDHHGETRPHEQLYQDWHSPGRHSARAQR